MTRLLALCFLVWQLFPFLATAVCGRWCVKAMAVSPLGLTKSFCRSLTLGQCRVCIQTNVGATWDKHTRTAIAWTECIVVSTFDPRWIYRLTYLIALLMRRAVCLNHSIAGVTHPLVRFLHSVSPRCRTKRWRVRWFDHIEEWRW